MSVMTLPAAVVPRAVPEARQRNRAEHFWALIERCTGRRKLHAAKDYIAAMLVDQPPDVVEAAVQAVEQIVNHQR